MAIAATTRTGVLVVNVAIVNMYTLCDRVNCLMPRSSLICWNRLPATVEKPRWGSID